MKNKLLLPRQFKIIGSVMLPFAIALIFYSNDHKFSFLEVRKWLKSDGLGFNDEFLLSPKFTGNLTLTLAMLFTFLALFFIAFAKEKVEDEYIRSVRLKALQISVYMNYFILAVATILFYGFSYLMVMEFNLFTILIIFILVYYYHLYIKPHFSKSNAA